MDGHQIGAEAKSVAGNVADAASAAGAQANEQAQAALKQASELGAEAIDQVDTWLRPYGLSLKENPGVTIAIIGGVALAAGALLMSRKTKADNVADQISAVLRRAGI